MTVKKPIKFDFNFMMEDVIGSSSGFDRAEIDRMVPDVSKACAVLAKFITSRDLNFANLPSLAGKLGVLKAVKEHAKFISEKFENFVLLGIGGSALGPACLIEALNPPYSQIFSKGKRIFICDNIDPRSFEELLEELDFGKTVFNVVSKSGGTVETLAQFLVVRDELIKRVGEKSYRDHLIITTDPKEGVLRKISNEEKIRSLEIPSDIVGRFSIFTPVGLLPAAVAGIDIDELLEGARFGMEKFVKPNLWENPAAQAL